MMNMEGNTGVGIAIAVLLIVLVGGWFVTSGARATYAPKLDMVMDNAETQTSSSSSAWAHPANPTEIAEGNSLSIADQKAGMEVAVSSLTLTDEGWIAIRDSVGKTLGAALFAPGMYENVLVPLLRTTTAGESYQALIYFDDGTKTFNLKTETIVLNTDGSVAGTTFYAR